MGNGGSTHHTHTIEYRTPPAVTKQLAEQKAKIDELDAQAKKLRDPKYFKENQKNLINDFIVGITKLELGNIIKKNAGETHIAIIGRISCGKTTTIKALFDIQLDTSLDDCTTGCNVVYNKNKLIVWDVAGDDQTFKYYDAETLSFIKDLDKCVLLFDDDINCNQNIIKVVHSIKGDDLLIVRNKCDQRDDADIRTVKEVQKRDTQKLRALGINMDTLCISAKDAVSKNYTHDWEEFAKFIC